MQNFESSQSKCKAQVGYWKCTRWLEKVSRIWSRFSPAHDHIYNIMRLFGSSPSCATPHIWPPQQFYPLLSWWLRWGCQSCTRVKASGISPQSMAVKLAATICGRHTCAVANKGWRPDSLYIIQLASSTVDLLTLNRTRSGWSNADRTRQELVIWFYLSYLELVSWVCI